MPETIRIHATHDFIMKVPSKRELQEIPSNHSSDIDFACFLKRYKDYTNEPYSILVGDATLSSNNRLIFRKKLIKKIVLVRKLKQSISKLNKAKLNMN